MKSADDDGSNDASSRQCYAGVPEFLWRHHYQFHLPPNNI